jgi:hypothetical protein
VLSYYYCCMQISKTDEIMLFKNCSPENYAAKIWRAVAEKPIMNPLEGVVSVEQLAAMRPLYTQKTVQEAEPWANSESVANPYTMLWVIANK